MSGAQRNATAAVCLDGELVAVCEQERLARVRRIGLRPGALPSEAVKACLEFASGRSLHDVDRLVCAEDDIVLPVGMPEARLEHHFAHAAAAVYLRPVDTAAVLVCDRHSRSHTSVWSFADGSLEKIDWPEGAAGLASLYSEAACVFGLPPGDEHQLEALARVGGTHEVSPLDHLMSYRDGAVWTDDRWKAQLYEWLSEAPVDLFEHRARVAAALQCHLGRLLLALAGDIRTKVGRRHLCLAGGLFYNTYFTTLVRQSGIFDDVLVAPNPGNAGIAAGAARACAAVTSLRHVGVSRFLGPEYDIEAIKRTLDNCKLSYQYLSDEQVIAVAVEALRHGRLVGWFQGRMEWGHRALGHRSILANPASPYVLDNLNVFLKRRQHHHAYGLSVPLAAVSRHFDGPPASPFMEYDYRVADHDRLHHVVPDGVSTLRVQTISSDDESLGGFRRLHEAFGQVTGIPVLVNTSFNGFSEPIVCSPRDAVRVFFGTGLDLLVLDRFVIEK